MPPSVDKLALFIDGASLHAASKTLDFEIDFKRLLKEYESHSNLVRAYYYTVMVEDREYSSIRPLTDWLDYNGYSRCISRFNNGAHNAQTIRCFDRKRLRRLCEL